jgi:3-deoxy-D-manno-octulosonate 8-phosphate phosphatase (KDO 8-P phosphatase)
MIFDVDGVLTDGTLWYGPAGEALKAFSAHDGHGIKLLAAAGVAVALLSGRRSKAVAVRARELGIKRVFQGVDDKLSVFEKLLEKEQTACHPHPERRA